MCSLLTRLKTFHSRCCAEDCRDFSLSLWLPIPSTMAGLSSYLVSRCVTYCLCMPVTYISCCVASLMLAVQAIAACLFIVGLKDESHQVVSKFTWGEGFHTLNMELLEAYSACSDSASVVACQQGYFDAWASEREERKRSSKGWCQNALVRAACL
jgi:hypothetical protein